MQCKKVVSAEARRAEVAYAQTRGMSQRAACRLFSVPRSTLDYQARMPAKDQPVIDRMRTMSAQQPRWGYRFVRVLLAREGMHMGWATRRPRPASSRGCHDRANDRLRKAQLDTISTAMTTDTSRSGSV